MDTKKRTTKTAEKKPGRKPRAKALAKNVTPDAPIREASVEAPKEPKEKKPKGRPKGSPDVWTPQYISELCDKLYAYIQSHDCPSIAEFCYLNFISRQRLYEHSELAELRVLMQDKREFFYEQAGQKLSKEDGPRGAFIIRALSHLGPNSWREKQELEHSGAIGVQIVDDIS